MRSQVRVGIIGAGIAGCSASYFTRKAIPAAVISVFEQASRLGGRVHTIEFAGHQVELGAGFLHSSNRTLLEVIAALGLRTRRPRKTEFPIGIWNGSHFSVMMSNRDIPTLLRLAARYGFSLIRMRRLIHRSISHWERVYEYLHEGRVFATPADLLDSLGLKETVSQTTDMLLARSRISGPIVDELANGITKAIFNQETHINGLAGMVALVGARLTRGTALSLVGGNARLCEELVVASGATLEMRSVSEVRVADGQMGAKITSVANGSRDDHFDAVILAAPLARSGLHLNGIDQSKDRASEFQCIHVTCVLGRLAETFRDRDTGVFPATILTTRAADIPFSTILRVDPRNASEDAVGIFKIQSRFELGGIDLSRIFTEIRDVRRVVWQAYPDLRPAGDCPPFRICPGVYYVSAMESVISTLETQAVASQNAIGLMLQDILTARQ